MTDVSSTDARSRKGPPYQLPVLPKGGAIGIGFVASLIAGLLFFVLAYRLIGRLFPDAMSIYIYAYVVWLVAFVVGGVIALALFTLGLDKKDIPIGWVGVPTLLGGRFDFFGSWLLYPEGKAWGVKNFLDYEKVDARALPLVRTEDPRNEEILVLALAKVKPPDVTTPPGAEPSDTTKEMQKVFSVPVTVKVVARRKVFDPFLFLDYDGVDGLLYNSVLKNTRRFVREEVDDAFKLPDLTEAATHHLEVGVDKDAREMGVDFITLMVTEILLPPKINAEAENLLIEWIQRSKEMFQAETLSKTAAILRKIFPQLGERELKNLVLSASSLATTQAVSIEGQQGSLSVVGIEPAPKGKEH